MTLLLSLHDPASTGCRRGGRHACAVRRRRARAARLVHRDPGQGQLAVPGWGSLTQVDTRGIDASTQLVRETRDALAAKGIQLEVLVLPDKTLFYQDKLPDGKALSPEVKRRYQTIQDKLKAAGIATFDDEPCCGA